MKKKKTRKNQLKQVVFGLIFILILYLILEAFFFIALAAIDCKNGKISFVSALKIESQLIKKAWRKNVDFGGFDPLTQVRHKPGGRYHKLVITMDGFIANANDDSYFDIFPEKHPDMLRVVMLGGSSMAGTGAGANQRTIPAKCEVMLNKILADSGKTYQVLNFGAAGGYTAAEMVKFLTQIIYIKPDVVVTFDGFNDVWNAVFEKERVGLDVGIINWSDFSYRYFELLNGYPQRDDYNPPKLFTYTVSFLKTVLSRDKDKISELYGKYPFYKQSKLVAQDNPYFDNVTFNNLDVMASYAAHNNIKLIAYLQPTALTGERKLSDAESMRVDSWCANYYKTSPIFAKDNFSRLMNESYKLLRQRYQQLETKYSDYDNVRFINLESVFNDTQEDVYYDIVHLYPEGNKVVARRMANDIADLLARKN